MPCPKRGRYNPLWHLFWRTDGEELLKARRRQKVQMARYMHAASPDEDLGFGAMWLRTFKDFYEELASIMADEAAPSLEG